MTKVLLIRHAAPLIDTAKPAQDWVLSSSGHEAAAALGAKLRTFAIDTLVASSERKALQTAQVIAKSVGLAVQTDDRLREHNRQSVGFLDRKAFEQGVASVFNNPSHIVFGEESADAVYFRFNAAIEDAKRAGGSVVGAVTHGTAMSIYIERLTGVAAMSFWQQLGMPTAVMLEANRIAATID